MKVFRQLWYFIGNNSCMRQNQVFIVWLFSALFWSFVDRLIWLPPGFVKCLNYNKINQIEPLLSPTKALTDDKWLLIAEPGHCQSGDKCLRITWQLGTASRGSHHVLRCCAPMHAPTLGNSITRSQLSCRLLQTHCRFTEDPTQAPQSCSNKTRDVYT